MKRPRMLFCLLLAASCTPFESETGSAPPDGGTSAADGGTGAGTGTFCKGKAATSCLDFDGPNAFGDWSLDVDDPVAKLIVSSDAAVSSPSSMRSELLAGATNFKTGRLERGLAKPLRQTRLELSVRVEALPPEGNQMSLAEVLCDSGGQKFAGVWLFVDSSGKTSVITDGNLGVVKSAGTLASTGFTRVVIETTWTQAKVTVGDQPSSFDLTVDCGSMERVAAIVGLSTLQGATGLAYYDDVLLQVAQ